MTTILTGLKNTIDMKKQKQKNKKTKQKYDKSLQ